MENNKHNITIIAIILLIGTLALIYGIVSYKPDRQGDSSKLIEPIWNKEITDVLECIANNVIIENYILGEIGNNIEEIKLMYASLLSTKASMQLDSISNKMKQWELAGEQEQLDHQFTGAEGEDEKDLGIFGGSLEDFINQFNSEDNKENGEVTEDEENITSQQEKISLVFKLNDTNLFETLAVYKFYNERFNSRIVIFKISEDAKQIREIYLCK